MGKTITKKVLVMENGSRFDVTDENGKYYICGETQFRKMNPQILKVAKEKIVEETKDDVPEEDGMVENIEKVIEKKKTAANGRKKASGK